MGMKKQYHKVIKGKVSRGTGAKKIKARDKRLIHVGGYETNTKVDAKKETKKVRTVGGNSKVKLKRAAYANVASGNSIKKAKILKVLESNTPTMTRQNIIVKGAIIQTEIGKAKVVSRPGQEGVINAVLIKEEKA